MFDFGFSEMVLAGVVALIVLGPERLPVVARTVGRWIGKIQAFAGSVKQELNRSGGLDELRSVKADFEQAAQEIRSEWRETETQLAGHTADIRQTAADLPAWERLPEMRTPEDFGVDGQGKPLAQVAPYDTAEECGRFGGHLVSLQRQARARKRDMRPRFRAKPKLRARAAVGRLKPQTPAQTGRQR